jgi:3-(3-hydroxy-phenyl)propionate hydroxylase
VGSEPNAGLPGDDDPNRRARGDTLTSDEPFDVAVVGAGPVGATCASLAARHGLRCLLVDESTEVFALPRAIHFDADAMRIFQFAGLAQQAEALARATTGGVHLGVDGEPIRTFRVKDAPGDLGWRPHYMFFQPTFDEMLRAHAASRNEVDARFGWRCEGLEDHGDHVRVALGDPAGAEHSVRASFVIAADGASSPSRRALDVHLDDYGFDEPWIVVDVEVPSDDMGPDHTVMYCDPARPATYIPGPGRHRRWEFYVLPGESGHEHTADARIKRLIADVTPWLRVERIDIVRSAVYRFHALIAERWRVGRVFLAGDAAHQTPPFYGQGMCHGLRDARNLMWKIAAVLEGRIGMDLLDSYQVEREPHVRAIIEAAVANGRYICTLDPDLAARRDRELRARMGEGRDVRSFREIIPGLTAGLLDQQPGSEAVGLLFVQPPVGRGRPNGMLLDDLLADDWALVTRVDDAVNKPLAGREVRVIVADDALADDGTLREWFATFGCVAALVRPDRYVFGTAATAAEIPDLLDRASQQMLRPDV